MGECRLIIKARTDILLLYFYREPFGPTVSDHLKSFEGYSKFKITSLNLAEPESTEALRKIDSACIVLHYTLFGLQYYLITEEQAWIVGDSRALKVAFFQDEYWNFPKRCRFIDEYGIDCVYTLIEPQYFRQTYTQFCSASMIYHTLAGYVSDTLLETARNITNDRFSRDIDVGYRGHELDIIFGLGGQEKRFIGEEFKARTNGRGMILDVETAVDKRIYGMDWYRFIARCKAMLGVEAGVSAFDLHDEIRLKVRKIRQDNSDASPQSIWEQVVKPFEENIYYRMISPRHLEAAALGTTQVLFEGRYTGLMDPMVHYIPLKKDFSNFDDVMSMLAEDSFCRKIAANARRDLIESGRLHYREFIAEFDRMLRLMGVHKQQWRCP